MPGGDRDEDPDGADRPGGPDRVFYLHTDGIGTVRLATDARGAVVWRWGGNAFGSSPPTGGRMPDPSGRAGEEGDRGASRPAVTINLRFPGQYYDRETGFFYNWARYYNPKTGRYISSDPIGLLGGVNTYGYVGGNPLRLTDPRGLATIRGSVVTSLAVNDIGAISIALVCEACDAAAAVYEIGTQLVEGARLYYEGRGNVVATEKNPQVPTAPPLSNPPSCRR